MNYRKFFHVTPFIMIVTWALIAPIDVYAKREALPKGYIFGFSASFKDSLIFFTNVQMLENAWIDTKSKFLLGRDNYSYQLRDYFTYNRGMQGRTCVVVFGKKRKDVEKKLLKLKKRYTVKAQGKFDVNIITDDEFHFSPIDMGDYSEPEPVKKTKNKDKDIKRGERPPQGAPPQRNEM